MCEEEYEYCTKCPHCILLSKINIWEARIRAYFNKTYCQVTGHIFKDIQPLTQFYNGRNIIQQRCKCHKCRYVYADTKEVLTDEEVNDYYGIMIIESLHKEVNLYRLLPKEPWKVNSNE